MRAFVKLREVLATHKELADKLTELERKVGTMFSPSFTPYIRFLLLSTSAIRTRIRTFRLFVRAFPRGTFGSRG